MKKKCLISANCQGAYIKALLESHQAFNNEYSVHYFVNYLTEKIPIDLIQSTDLLIYQPIGDRWGEHSEKHLLDNVPSKCLAISISYLTFPIYWPNFCDDSRNISSSEYPFGPFPYGDRYVIESLKNNIEPSSILNHILGDKYFLNINIDNTINQYYKQQFEIETRRSQKILEFIMDNFKNIKLFETYNHPAWDLCAYQANDLLVKIGFEPYDLNLFPNLPYLKSNQQPIHPQIASMLNLKFEANHNTLYNIWGKKMVFKNFINAYINWDIDSIGKGDYSHKKSNNCQEKYVVPKSKPHAKETTMERDSQIFFIHIPKTAGTSLNEMLDEAFPDCFHPHYNASSILIEDKLRRTRPLIRGHIHYCLSASLAKNLQIFTFLRNPVDMVISAFEFMKAHPETWLGKFAQGSIDEFLENEYSKFNVSNTQTRMLGSTINSTKLYKDLALKNITYDEFIQNYQKLNRFPVDDEVYQRAMSRLSSFLHVGFTENFSNDCKVLFDKLGVKCPEMRHSNKTPSKFKKRDRYPTSVIEKIERMNNYDIRLYNAQKNIHL